MGKYINKRIYTDIESYLVTEIDEVKGTAMASASRAIEISFLIFVFSYLEDSVSHCEICSLPFCGGVLFLCGKDRALPDTAVQIDGSAKPGNRLPIRTGQPKPT